MQRDYYLVNDMIGTIELHPGDLKIFGREPTNDIVLKDLMVSRRHARIFWDGSGFVLEDLDSRNGTFLDGEKIRVAPLGDGTSLRVGPFVFTYRESAPEDPLESSDPWEIMETVSGVAPGVNFCDTGLTGDLSTLGITELIQTLHQGQKTGVLIVLDQEFKGQIFFQDGEIVHARAGIWMDKDALFRALQLTSGFFEFNDCTPPPAHTIVEGTMALLMESFRRADERRR